MKNKSKLQKKMESGELTPIMKFTERLLSFTEFCTEKWVTIKGTHVELDGDGKIISGPDNLKNYKGETSKNNTKFDKSKAISEIDKLLSDTNKIMLEGRLEKFYKKNPKIDPKKFTLDHAKAISCYTTRSYGEFNNTSTKISNDARKLLDEALSQLPNKTGTMMRKTDLPDDLVKQILESDEMTTGERYTSSTQYDIKEMEMPFYGHTFNIKSKSGKDISELSSYPEEGEVVFPRNTKFKIVSKTKESTFNDNYIFELEEI